MQRLYGCVPLLNVVGGLMFLMIVSLQPAPASSWGVDFDWQQANVIGVSLLVVFSLATAFARSRRMRRLGLLLNALLIVGMAIALWRAKVPDAISDYLWLWALMMTLNAALIGWGWFKLRNQKNNP